MEKSNVFLHYEDMRLLAALLVVCFSLTHAGAAPFADGYSAAIKPSAVEYTASSSFQASDNSAELSSRCCIGGRDVVSSGLFPQCNNGDCPYIKPAPSTPLVHPNLHIGSLDGGETVSGKRLVILLRPPIG